MATPPTFISGKEGGCGVGGVVFGVEGMVEGGCGRVWYSKNSTSQ